MGGAVVLHLAHVTRESRCLVSFSHTYQWYHRFRSVARTQNEDVQAVRGAAGVCGYSTGCFSSTTSSARPDSGQLQRCLSRVQGLDNFKGGRKRASFWGGTPLPSPPRPPPPLTWVAGPLARCLSFRGAPAVASVAAACTEMAGMADAAKRVRRLPEGIISRIRTGVTAPTVAQIVEELVANAVDGLASQITVQLDLDTMTVIVEDNVGPLRSSSSSCRARTASHACGPNVAPLVSA